MEPDEQAIYGWINPARRAEDVKSERRRMIAALAIRHGVHHYLDDIWQEWQLAVYQRSLAEQGPPVDQREYFTFGIARNLCRGLLRMDQRQVFIASAGEGDVPRSSGIREQALEERRADRPAGPANKAADPLSAGEVWGDAGKVAECIRRLPQRARQMVMATYVEGRTSQEAGEQLGTTAENARQILRRARDELRRCVNGKSGAV